MRNPALSITRNSISLGLFCLTAAILLVTAYTTTRERIQEQQLAAERRSLAEIFPSDLHDNDLLQDALLLTFDTVAYEQPELLQLTVSRTAYRAYYAGAFSGVILPVEAHDGYSGDIRLLVGILADGSISGTRVIEHRETPGLGDKIDITLSDWILDFNDRSLVSPVPSRWKVKKDGGDFDQLVGATVTPRAVVNAVRRALLFFELNRKTLETY